MRKYIWILLTMTVVLTGCQPEQKQVNQTEYKPTPVRVVEKKENNV